MAKVCLVEDDPIMGESLQQRFELEGVICDLYQSAEDALEPLIRGDYAALISDIRLPDMTGEQLFKRILASPVGLLPTLFMTGYGTVEQAVHLLKMGASDYITKPFDLDELLNKLRKICPELYLPDDTEEAILGISEPIRQIERKLQRAIRFPVPILITGDSGVGKEHAARYFRDCLSQGKKIPFVSINCAAVQESLLEAELFGHEKGAFTGADRQRQGLFEQADGGVLFLDELGEMSLSMQVKLLRSLQESVVRRVGGVKDIPVNVRIVCATNRDLSVMIEKGTFREDLYYRINVVSVHLPPLSERREDIIWFAHRLVKGCNEIDNTICYRLTAAAESWLVKQDWPGNIRQMKNTIERACIYADNGRLEATLFESPELHEEKSSKDYSLREYIEVCERDRIKDELAQHEGRITETATTLGISRKNLWEKMRKYGL